MTARLRAARPRPADVDLLRAAVLDGEPARAAYRRWVAAADLARLDDESDELLPRLFRNLERLGVRDANEPRLRGIWRHAWVHNNKLVHAVAPALAALRDAGVPTLLLKGSAALADGALRDTGVRPMADVDVLVPRERVFAAAAALGGVGWHPANPRPLGTEFPVRQSAPFAAGAEWQLDLHWEALFDPGADDGLWARARPAVLGTQPTAVPAPSDQLLVTCLHAGGWHGKPIRWLADAATLLARHPDPGWDDLVAEAAARGAGHRLAGQLELLRELLGTPVPPAVLDRLRAAPLPLRERVLHRATDLPHGGVKVFLTSWDHARRARDLPGRDRPRALAWALAEYEVTSVPQLARLYVRRSARRARGLPPK